MADREVWLVSAVSYKGERFTHGYAFFSEASALHHIERELLEDAERVKHGRQCIHAPDSWQVVRYVPESAKAEAQPAGTGWVTLDEGELVARLTEAMRVADRRFEQVGGSTRHHVRDCLVPALEEAGLTVIATRSNMEPGQAGKASNCTCPKRWNGHTHECWLRVVERLAVVVAENRALMDELTASKQPTKIQKPSNP